MPRPPRQSSFWKPPSPEHGASLAHGRRKIKRPLDPRRPVHLTLRALQARGRWSMLARANKARVEDLAEQLRRKYRLEFKRFANVGNHLHLVVRFKKSQDLQGFMREFSGRAAQMITGARKGHGLKQRFWDELAYTRVLEWGRDYLHAINYVVRNSLEALDGGKRDPRARLMTFKFERPPDGESNENI